MQPLIALSGSSESSTHAALTLGSKVREEHLEWMAIEDLVAEGLIKIEVAARLDPEKCYGIWWFNRYRYTRKMAVEIGPDGQRAHKKKQKYVMRPREEWIAVPVPDVGVPSELVDAAREAIKNNGPPSSA